jgi:hypothetical protein
MVGLDKTCYLCGKALTEPINRDHVPPQQFYADKIREKHKLNLLTLPVHRECNSAYQLDEDYFVHSLMPFGKGSYSGNEFYAETLRKFRSGKRKERSLMRRVMNEFEHRPTGLILPRGKIAKRFDGARLRRVAWKIVRGLYFHHFRVILPQDLVCSLRMVLPDDTPPPDFIAITNEPTHGQYPGVFDYRFASFPELNNFHYWTMLLWDRILLLIAFHDPACICEFCTSNRIGATAAVGKFSE